MKSKKIYIGCLIPMVFMSCLPKDEDSIRSQWKYSGGYYFGDWLDLEHNPAQLRNDTLFRDAVPFAKLISIKKGYFGYPTKMELESFENKERGFYVDKGN